MARRGHRLGGLILGLVALTLVVAACAGSSTSSGTTTTDVKVMLDWTPNTNHAGMYLARQEGYYRRAGLKVTFLEPGQGSDPNQAVGAGTVDFGVSASEQLVPARAAGVPVVSLAAIIQHNTSSLITLKSSGIARPRQLAGHTYGAFGGTFEKALVDELVSCDGGDASKVRFTQVGDADYRQGLTSGQYDAVWVFDGWDVIRLSDIDHIALNRMPFANYTRCIPDWYTPILVTSEKLIQKQPGLVRRFMTATAHGYRDAMAHPDQAASALLAGAKDSTPTWCDAARTTWRPAMPRTRRAGATRTRRCGTGSWPSSRTTTSSSGGSPRGRPTRTDLCHRVPERRRCWRSTGFAIPSPAQSRCSTSRRCASTPTLSCR